MQRRRLARGPRGAVLSWKRKAIRGNENPGRGCEKQSVQSRKVLCRIRTGDNAAAKERSKGEDMPRKEDRQTFMFSATPVVILQRTFVD